MLNLFLRNSNATMMRYTAIGITVFLILNACQKEQAEVPSYEFNIDQEGESSVHLSWSDIEAGNNLRIVVDETDDFDSPVLTREPEASLESITLDGLSPMTDYFMRIEVRKDQETTWSEDFEFSTSYYSEVVKFNSTDNVELAANLAYISTKLTSSSKTILFLHEFQSSRSSWLITGIIDTMISDGNICLALDFRGHGSSTFEGDITQLLEEPWMLREDFDATLDFLDTISLDWSGEIIVCGASMGACVATVGSSNENVLGGVAASAVESLSIQMTDEALIPKGMFYIAGERDKNITLEIDYERDANNLFKSTIPPARVEILKDDGSHGVSLFESSPGLIPEVIDWIRAL